MGKLEIEEIINKIIQMDQKAMESQQKFEKIKKENEKKLKETCRQMEEDIIQEARRTADNKYKEEIEKCNILVNSILEEGEQKIKRLNDSFEKIRQGLSESIFKEIFEID
ncbi:MAG TPA: hypothetical protein PLL17_07325 [Defluviitaleaceae bacterium]|nr:hypothetical protein [Candidatus Epulonipiscium sp.]HOQ16816.1 hypothetical protein [Defluviitaleaceae bacterium]HPT75709.1 hypothetical protein [Defluviitaleaceae bacterium]HQD50919.1 hypothetical protein [Defluviitaleaceae bacterium]